MAVFSAFPPIYWAKKIPQRTAIVWKRGNTALLSDFPSQLSWQQLGILCSQCVNWLEKRYGKLFNRTVVFIGSNRLLSLLCYLSVLAAGGRILLLNPALPLSQQQAIFADLDVHYVINEGDFADFSPNFTACIGEFPIVWEVDKAATLTLTSGSSGDPKAAVHSMAAHLLNAQGVCHLMGFTQNDNWLLSLPLFHVSGQGILWRWLLQGATLSIYEDKADFYPLLANVSHASLVPTQLQRYLKQSQVKLGQKILLGGAYIPSELIEQAQQVGLTTFAGYGMTEAASTICAVENETDNVGKPLLGREVKIIDDQIWLRSQVLALGYWQKGDIVPLVDQFGWFATKDKGTWTENGQLVITGRLDNMFISGGENIQPEQIEQVLYTSGLLETVFIVPQYDQEFGERPVAFIHPFHTQAVEKLQQFAKLHLEKFKQPIAYYALSDYNEITKSGIKISRKGLQTYLSQHLATQRV